MRGILRCPTLISCLSNHVISLVGHMNKFSFFSLGHEIYLRISFKNLAHFFNSVILNSLYFFYCEEAGQITSCYCSGILLDRKGGQLS